MDICTSANPFHCMFSLGQREDSEYNTRESVDTYLSTARQN